MQNAKIWEKWEKGVIMDTQLIDHNGGKPVAYESTLVNPKNLSIFGSDLCLKVVAELAKQPGCAMDLSRKLNQHEQKIYYHLRRLEKSGIIKQIRTEKRYGMTAKIYDVISPVVATKLYDDGYPLENQIKTKNPKVERFLYPFIKNGKLNAKIIVGNPHEHGRHDSRASDSVHVADLIHFLGSFIKKPQFPCYIFDTQVKKEDLKDNLILIGNPKHNTVVDKINQDLPVFFDHDNEWAIVSKPTNKTYTNLASGIILITTNPFNKKKKILLLAGKRSRGTKAAIIALTQNTDKLITGERDQDLIRVVMGLDRDNDYEVDHVRFLE